MEQAAVGLAAAMAGFIVLLLVGTQILDWYWPVVLFVATAAWGAWRTRRRIPSKYQLAQGVDRRLGLADTLSTAYFFGQDGARRGARAMVTAQREEAERASRGVTAEAAAPFAFPRPLYAASALTFLAGGLFFVRYGVRGSLDLRPPLVEAVFDYFRPSQLATRNRPPTLPPGPQPIGLSLDGVDRQLDAAPDSALEVSDTPQFEDSTPATEKAGRAKAPANPEGGEDQEEGSENAEGSRGDPKAANQPDSGQKSGQPNQGNQGQKGRSPEDSGLMNKLKDAMANLMARLKTPPQGSQTEAASSKMQGGQKSGTQSEKGQSVGKPEGQGTPTDEDQGQPGQPGEQAQAGQSNSSDKSSEQSDSKTGAGKSDGAKDAREAAQLEAMGKISELFGRRAANVTGEVMVEVNSGKQQSLKTPYSNRSATHRDAGGEISRDEIPLAVQHFVQQYFEEVRKAAPPAKAKPGVR